jgi:archaellum biogenesis ATPase FlaH
MPNAQKDFLTTQLDKVNAIPVPVEKNTYTFAELWKEKDFEQKFLIPELIPKSTLCVLIGEDGIGKTQVTTQLCLSISLGFASFMDLPLNVEHKRCLIVATEDSRQKFTKAIVKQTYALAKVDANFDPTNVKISFTEGSNFDTFDALLVEIVSLLKLEKYEVIIMDALSDLFTMIDGEINSNSHARKILSKLQAICNTYQVTIILIHHAAKSKVAPKQAEGKIFLDKFDSQGAGAITQKPRTILSLSNDPQSVSADGKSYTNYLHCVKANLMSKHFVSSAIKMQFDGETLLHRYEDLIKIEDWNRQNLNQETKEVTMDNGRKRKAKPAELPADIHQDFMDAVFTSDTLTFDRKGIVYEMVKFYNIGETKISGKDGFLNFLVDNKYLENVGGTYFKAGTVPF